MLAMDKHLELGLGQSPRCSPGARMIQIESFFTVKDLIILYFKTHIRNNEIAIKEQYTMINALVFVTHDSLNFTALTKTSFSKAKQKHCKI